MEGSQEEAWPGNWNGAVHRVTGWPGYRSGAERRGVRRAARKMHQGMAGSFRPQVAGIGEDEGETGMKQLASGVILSNGQILLTVNSQSFSL